MANAKGLQAEKAGKGVVGCGGHPLRTPRAGGAGGRDGCVQGGSGDATGRAIWVWRLASAGPAAGRRAVPWRLARRIRAVRVKIAQ